MDRKRENFGENPEEMSVEKPKIVDGNAGRKTPEEKMITEANGSDIRRIAQDKIIWQRQEKRCRRGGHLTEGGGTGIPTVCSPAGAVPVLPPG